MTSGNSSRVPGTAMGRERQTPVENPRGNYEAADASTLAMRQRQLPTNPFNCGNQPVNISLVNRRSTGSLPFSVPGTKARGYPRRSGSYMPPVGPGRCHGWRSPSIRRDTRGLAACGVVRLTAFQTGARSNRMHASCRASGFWNAGAGSMGRWDRSCWQDCRARERVHRSGLVESTSMKCHDDSQRSGAPG